MMLVTGKTSSNKDRSLSIQQSLDGLSFFDSNSKTDYSTEEAILLLNSTIITDGKLAEITLSINTNRFVAIPQELYEESCNNNYLFAKDIVKEDNETILSSNFENIVLLFMIDTKLLKQIRLAADELTVKHSLEYIIETGKLYAEIKRKNCCCISIYNETLSFAMYQDKKLIAFDCFINCDYIKTSMIIKLITEQYKISNAVVISDDNDILKLATKKVIKKVEYMPKTY